MAGVGDDGGATVVVPGVVVEERGGTVVLRASTGIVQGWRRKAGDGLQVAPAPAAVVGRLGFG
jgi:hypothetical protein